MSYNDGKDTAGLNIRQEQKHEYSSLQRKIATPKKSSRLGRKGVARWGPTHEFMKGRSSQSDNPPALREFVWPFCEANVDLGPF